MVTMENNEPIPRYRYPKCVIFLLVFEFCERFCFHEIFSIVAVYLTSYLQLTESFTITYYHALLTLTYLFPSFGSVLSYSFLGKFKLVAYAGCVYIVSVLLLLLATIPSLNLPQVPLSLTSLVLITVTAGTLKPCIPLIGGDQFSLPAQEDQLSTFFSTFNLMIVVSALAGKTVAPFMREHVLCFGESSCFSAVFGISFVLIITGTVIFCLGGRYYKVVNCEDNIVTTHVNWILEALKIKHHTNPPEKPPSPTANPMHQLKTLLRIWCTILPFIALSGASDIRSSLMFFQAMRMDGDVGFYDILPDQFAVVEAAFTLPLFAFISCVVFPWCRRSGLVTKALPKVAFGGGLVAASLLGAGALSLVMERHYPVLPVAGQGQISVYNTLPCDLVISSGQLGLKRDVILSGGVLSKICRVKTCEDFPYTITSACLNETGLLKMCEQESFSYFFRNYNLVGLEDNTNFTRGAARFRSFVNLNENNSRVNLKPKNGSWVYLSNFNFKDIPFGFYSSTIGNFTHNFNITENDYTLLVIARNNSYVDFSISEKMKPHRLKMLWMMPHRLLNCLGEMIATSAVLEFCYSEAPENIKNIAVAGYYLMISAGNVVIIAMEAICPFQELSYKFFLYAGLLLFDLLLLAFTTKNYKPPEEK